MSKKIMSILCILIVLCFAVTGCGNNGSTSSSNIEGSVEEDMLDLKSAADDEETVKLKTKEVTLDFFGGSTEITFELADFLKEIETTELYEYSDDKETLWLSFSNPTENTDTNLSKEIKDQKKTFDDNNTEYQMYHGTIDGCGATYFKGHHKDHQDDSSNYLCAYNYVLYLELDDGNSLVIRLLSNDTEERNNSIMRAIINGKIKQGIEDDSSNSESEDSTGAGIESWTTEQQNCYETAISYLNLSAFSKQGLIDQLSSEYGDAYPVDVATFVVNNIEKRKEVDWDEQAEKAARSYLETGSFSKQGLIDQLSSEYGSQFTVEQAKKAVDKVYK